MSPAIAKYELPYFSLIDRSFDLPVTKGFDFQYQVFQAGWGRIAARTAKKLVNIAIFVEIFPILYTQEVII